MTKPLIKICGISDEVTLAHAMQAGADFGGFVHFEKSPRHVKLAMLGSLIRMVKPPTKSVVVLVDPPDSLIDQIFAHAQPDYLQLHGKESPERIRKIKEKYGVKIIKAIGVSDADDISTTAAYEGIADMILFDAKPPKDAENAGGFGKSFNWELLNSFTAEGEEILWMLSGGLSAENIAQALAQTNAPIVDVSSHVETPVGSGKKDLDKISEFIHRVRMPS